MDEAVYLERIGLQRPTGTTAAALTALHTAHATTVPFEDYDIHLGIPLSLDLDDLQDKLLTRRRGGFCYELNGAFAALLRSLGFTVTLHSAFELADDGTRGPDFEHLRLSVLTDDGPYLADVGNGGSWTAPVPMVPGVHGRTRISREDDLWWAERLTFAGEWEREWAWTSAPRELPEFVERCRYQERDPASHFVQRRLAALATGDGRISVVNGLFKETAGETQTERKLDAGSERRVLVERFGIVLPDLPWL